MLPMNAVLHLAPFSDDNLNTRYELKLFMPPPPGSNDQGHIVFVLSVCLSVCLFFFVVVVCLFVCLSVANFHIRYNF